MRVGWEGSWGGGTGLHNSCRRGEAVLGCILESHLEDGQHIPSEAVDGAVSQAGGR